jgi:hypothetical protein
MTAMTITPPAPTTRLRRLPAPVVEPRAALRVIRDDDTGATPTSVGQECLDLGSAPQLRLVSDPEPCLPAPPAVASAVASGARSAVPSAVPRQAQPASPTVAPGVTPTARSRRDLLLRQHQESLRPGIRNAAPGSYDDIDDFCAPVATPTSQLPDSTRWAGQFVQAAVEVALGQRPISQLVRWTSEDVHLTLSRRAQLAQRAGDRRGGQTTTGRRAPRPRVQSVHGCSPRDGVAEATVVVNDGARIRAVAVRLEGWDGRWRVTALQLG